MGCWYYKTGRQKVCILGRRLVMYLLQRFTVVALFGVVFMYAAPPTDIEIRQTRAERNVHMQATQLLDIVNRAEGNFFDVAMQNEFAAVLEFCLMRMHQQQRSMITTLFTLLEQSKTTPLL